MRYWLLSLPRHDMEHCIQIGTFGASRKGPLGKAKKGDKVLCYVSGDCKIIAHGTTTTDYYLDDRKIFRSEGEFPDRIDFEAKKLSKSSEVDVRSIVDDLSFVTNKAFWSVFFRFSNREIPKTDYDLIFRRAAA